MWESTAYVHVKTGMPIVLSVGIGTHWSVYMEKPNGSLRRLKQFGNHRDLNDALMELENYQGKTIKKREAA